MTTTKDVMKDRQSVKELCYFKNGLTYPNKNCREISYIYLFCKNEETTLGLLRKLHTVCTVSRKFIRTQPGKKS